LNLEKNQGLGREAYANTVKSNLLERASSRGEPLEAKEKGGANQKSRPWKYLREKLMLGSSGAILEKDFDKGSQMCSYKRLLLGTKEKSRKKCKNGPARFRKEAQKNPEGHQNPLGTLALG